MALGSGINTNTGPNQRLWPVFALLLAVVVLPTAGVLWFMNQAMQNEQLAVRQRFDQLDRILDRALRHRPVFERKDAAGKAAL